MSRTPEQVFAAARAMDQSLEQGMPEIVLAIMLAARAANEGKAPWPDQVDLARVIACPQARQVDELLWWAIRRRVRS